MSIEFSGLQEVKVKLSSASKTVRPLVQAAVAKSTRQVEADAKALAPVDTGTLRSSIAATISGMTGEVTPGANYAIYQEFGTSRMGAQPFLFPALERQAGPFTEAVKNAAGKVF